MMNQPVSGYSRETLWRAGGFVTAVSAALLLVLVNGAVGFLGNEDNGANAVFVVVLAVFLTGSVVARFRPAGMMRAMVATAVAQVAVGLLALVGQLGAPGWKGLYEVVLGTGLFTGLWLFAAWQFRKATA